MFSLVLLAVAIALGLFGVLIGAFVVGWRTGRRARDDHPQLGVLQGATLGLLGLIIGFSFSGATQRFVERQDLLVREANTLGTIWLRTDLLAEPARGELRGMLRRYVATRLELFRALADADVAACNARLAAQQAELWRRSVQAVEAAPDAAVLLLPQLNESFDLLTTRNHAVRRHLPLPVLAVMVACAAISVGSVGYGLAGATRPLVWPGFALVALIGAVIWVTIDMDHPRWGLIRVSDAPLTELQRSFGP